MSKLVSFAGANEATNFTSKSKFLILQENFYHNCSSIDFEVKVLLSCLSRFWQFQQDQSPVLVTEHSPASGKYDVLKRSGFFSKTHLVSILTLNTRIFLHICSSFLNFLSLSFVFFCQFQKESLLFIHTTERSSFALLCSL